MELKLGGKLLSLKPNKGLQSHLYGIEIILIDTPPYLGLELQSHLYGIEIFKVENKHAKEA